LLELELELELEPEPPKLKSLEPEPLKWAIPKQETTYNFFDFYKNHNSLLEKST